MKVDSMAVLKVAQKAVVMADKTVVEMAGVKAALLVVSMVVSMVEYWAVLTVVPKADPRVEEKVVQWAGGKVAMMVVASESR